MAPRPRSDGEPVDAAAPRDRHEEFVRLLVAHHDRLLAYVYSLVGQRHDAEDVLQRASLIMWRKFDQFESESDFLAWATSVAYYEARNFLRVAERDRLRLSEALVEQLARERLTDVGHVERRLEALAECLDALDDAARGLLRTVYGGSRSVKELAHESGRAPQTFYNRLAALRRLLLECVERKLTQTT